MIKKGILIQRASPEDANYTKQLKMEHADLVAEMQTVESLPTHERLQLARLRRAQQLKLGRQKEKEWLKLQRTKDHGSSSVVSGGGNIVTNSKQISGEDITSICHTTHHFRHANGGSTLSGRRHISFENSVVLLEAASRNDIQEVAALLQNGITPDAANEDGLTALHQCCIDNNNDMLRLLLEYGANVDAQDSDKWTPLHAAATCGHLELVRILIEHGANLLAVNTDGNMPYDLCDDENTLDFIESEMAQRGVTQELIDETRSSTERLMLRDLMDFAHSSRDFEEPDSQGATPLHIAAANGYLHVVEFLLEQHVNVDAMDNDLWTPVHAAACWGHMEVLEMLAQCGADLNVKNKDNETPSDICEDPEIRERIEQLKTEQESKRLAEAQRKRVRRSQSNNTRAQSVRRTSLRDKTLTTKKDAVEEARMRLQAQKANTGSAAKSTAATAVLNGDLSNGCHGFHHVSNSNNNNSMLTVPKGLPHSKSADTLDTTTTHSYFPRRPPEGRENDDLQQVNGTCTKNSKMHHTTSAASIILTERKESKATSTADTAEAVQIQSSKEAANGKINVQVTVLVDTNTTYHQQLSEHATVALHDKQQQHHVATDSGAATLANLKKQRSLSRSVNALNTFELLTPQTKSATNQVNGSVLGAATTMNNNDNANNNNDNNTNNNNSGAMTAGPNTAQPLRGLASMTPNSLVEFSTATANGSVNKFIGITGDVVSDSTSSTRKCCVLM